MVSIFVYQKVQILPLLLQKIVLSRIPLIQNNVKLAKRITRWIQLVNAQSVQRVILQQPIRMRISYLIKMLRNKIRWRNRNMFKM